MKRLISAELLKARTTRALPVAAAVILVLAAALPFVNAAFAGSGDAPELEPSSLASFLRAPMQLAGAAVLLIGILASAGEHRHRTVLQTRLVEPQVMRLLAAKTAAVALVGLALGVVVELVAVAAGVAVLARDGIAVQPGSHGVVRIALLVPVVLALHGVLGVALGTLLRNPAAAVGGALMWAFVVEGAVPVVTRRPELVDWMPTGLIRSVLTGPIGDGPVPLIAAVVLAAYAAALLTAAALSDRVRPV